VFYEFQIKERFYAINYWDYINFGPKWIY